MVFTEAAIELKRDLSFNKSNLIPPERLLLVPVLI